MSDYRFSARAARDLRSIVARIARECGSRRAESYRSEIVRSVANIAEYPEMGHFRPDVTAKAVRFWAVYSHLIVYWPDSKPLRIARILHGALDPSDLRDRVGEPLGQYAASPAAVIDVPLNVREQEYLDARVRLDGAARRADLLLGALRCMEDPDGEEPRAYEAWREAARRSIEIGHQECLEGKTVDGEEAMERLRLELATREGC